MPKKSNKRSNKRRTRKQKTVLMIGCSSSKKGNKKSHRNKKNFSSLGNKSCPKCGPKCHCGPKCNCSHNCPGNCYLNRRYKGGVGCGSPGCPISPLSVKQMNNQYKVSSERLLPLFNEAQELKTEFDMILFVHVYRTQNKRADELSNMGLLLHKQSRVSL